MNKFSKLGLSDSTVEVLDQLGYETPTEIQSQAIPLLLSKASSDFIGLAQTGTGKTAAFGLPLIELVDTEDKKTQALILAPTRELGQQTGQQLKMFASKNKQLNVEVVYGGAAITNQIKALKKPTQIVVATPGRLIDLVKRKAVKLQDIKYVILDEADEMLNMGFKEEIDEILSHVEGEHATWLFSATMPKEIRRIIKKFMSDPVEISVNSDQKSNIDITHQYVVTTTANKLAAIRRFLDIHPEMRGIMFCRTKLTTQELANDLGNLGYGVEALHGDLSQAQRDAVMQRFKARSMQLLIATDVAARGIDVNDLTHVLHQRLPDQLDAYTHRSGRTGRAGKKGISIAFVNPREVGRIKDIERKIDVTFEKITVPTLSEVKASRIQHWAELIKNTSIDPEAFEIMQQLSGEFSEMNKEELLKRLITTQLDQLGLEENGLEDLNERVGDKKRKPVANASGLNKFFLNVGLIDGVTKGDLVHFISDVSGISRKQVGEISLQKNCTFFEAEVESTDAFVEAFRGVEVDGRNIRINLEEGELNLPGNNKSSRSNHSGGARKRTPHRKNRRGRHHR